MTIAAPIRMKGQPPLQKSLVPSESQLATPPWWEHVPDPSDRLLHPSLHIASALECKEIIVNPIPVSRLVLIPSVCHIYGVSNKIFLFAEI